jgi:hypothetical protein
MPVDEEIDSDGVLNVGEMVFYDIDFCADRRVPFTVNINGADCAISS